MRRDNLVYTACRSSSFRFPSSETTLPLHPTAEYDDDNHDLLNLSNPFDYPYRNDIVINRSQINDDRSARYGGNLRVQG